MASSGLELLWVSLPQLGKGAAQTLSISFLSIAFSTIGGVVYGVLRTLNVRAINLLLRIYLELFRAIPVLVWLYLLFFGLPIFTGLSIPSFWCAVLVLSLWGAARYIRCRAGSGRRGCRLACRRRSSTATCCCPRRSNA